MTSVDRLMVAGELPTATSASYGRINNIFVLLVEFRTLEAHDERVTCGCSHAGKAKEQCRKSACADHATQILCSQSLMIGMH